MNETFSKLTSVMKRPGLYQETPQSFWNTPYISNHVLEAHLDDQSDDASRRAETISRSLDFLEKQLPHSSSVILDLGCGPGLYAQPLAERGHQVTAVDYSPASIEYARERAKETGLFIDYQEEDFLNLEYSEGSFDAVLMIYGSFGTLTPEKQQILLSHIRKWLKPGGLFFFDLFTPAYLEQATGKDWYYRGSQGFWREGEHIVLEDKIFYRERQVRLDRYIVLEAEGYVTPYHIWHTSFDRMGAEVLLEKEKFMTYQIYGDLTGKLWTTESQWLGICAYKKE